MRIDKWLWGARFFKTRGLAQAAIAAGQVRLNDERVKPAREVRISDRLTVRIGEMQWQVEVRALPVRRGPAAEARMLYQESEASRAAREQQLAARRWSVHPGARVKGRPTKRERRRIDSLTEDG